MAIYYTELSADFDLVGGQYDRLSYIDLFWHSGTVIGSGAEATLTYGHTKTYFWQVNTDEHGAVTIAKDANPIPGRGKITAVYNGGGTYTLKFYIDGVEKLSYADIVLLDSPHQAAVRLASQAVNSPVPQCDDLYFEASNSDTRSYAFSSTSEADAFDSYVGDLTIGGGVLYLDTIPGLGSLAFRAKELAVTSTPPPVVSIAFSPSPDGEGTATPEDTAFVLHEPFEWDNAQIVAPASDPGGYSWLYWDFGGGDERASKTQEFELNNSASVVATYEAIALGLSTIQAVIGGDVGRPIWTYQPHDDALYEQVVGDVSETSILAQAASNPSAWMQPGGRRYVAFDLDDDTQYIFYNGEWGDSMLIKADRTDPATLMLQPSRDVFVVCLATNDLKLNVLRWNGASYDVETEIDVGYTANATGDMWLGHGGTVWLAYVDISDDIQTISSDLSGQTWT